MLRRTTALVAALVVLTWGAAAGAQAGTKTTTTETLSNGEVVTTTTSRNGTNESTTLTMTAGRWAGHPPAGPVDMDAGAGGTLVADTSGRSCNRGAKADAKSHVDLEGSKDEVGFGFDTRSSSLQVRVLVVNEGTAASRGFVSAVYLYPASDPCRAYRVGTIRTRAIPAHDGRTLAGVFDLAASSRRPPAGDYRIGVVVDVENSVAEGDETNNVFFLVERLRFE